MNALLIALWCSKPLITTSGGGVVGDSGPVPMSEELPVDTTAQPFCLRALSERVRPLTYTPCSSASLFPAKNFNFRRSIRLGDQAYVCCSASMPSLRTCICMPRESRPAKPLKMLPSSGQQIFLLNELQDTLLAIGRGVRSCVIRLPPYVYGNAGPGFAAWQLAGFAKAGACYYFGTPDHMVS